jgi:hypothetical protein
MFAVLVKTKRRLLVKFPSLNLNPCPNKKLQHERKFQRKRDRKKKLKPSTGLSPNFSSASKKEVIFPPLKRS